MDPAQHGNLYSFRTMQNSHKGKPRQDRGNEQQAGGQISGPHGAMMMVMAVIIMRSMCVACIMMMARVAAGRGKACAQGGAERSAGKARDDRAEKRQENDKVIHPALSPSSD